MLGYQPRPKRTKSNYSECVLCNVSCSWYCNDTEKGGQFDPFILMQHVTDTNVVHVFALITSSTNTVSSQEIIIALLMCDCIHLQSIG